jgi:hypothetical protein
MLPKMRNDYVITNDVERSIMPCSRLPGANSKGFNPRREIRLQSVELTEHPGVDYAEQIMEANMGFGKGALLWLIGIPLPIIILLALFMHH